MKKDCITGSPCGGIKKKWGRIMRLTFLFMVCCMLTVSANSYSQTTRLDINLSNRTITEIMEFVEDNSEFVFLYKNEDLDMNKKMDIQLQDATIFEILDAVLREQPVAYDVYERQIILREKDKSISGSQSSQQQKSITGVVTDTNGQPLPGVTVVVAGTSTGTVTNGDGEFSLTIPENAESLQFSFVGMRTQEAPIEGRTTFTVVMEEETIGVDEVVVTALGISREKKALGYAVTKIDSEELQVVGETNVINSLSGKVAGLNIIKGSGVGSSSRVVLRGDATLSTSGNSPLIVIDGIPIDNSSNSGNVDFGTGISDIDDANIEEISVLKGPAASALYGSRAANGVIIITSKKAEEDGVTVEFNQRTSFETPLRLPKFQNVYGQGYNGEFWFYDGNRGGVNDHADESWGPPMDGRLIAQFDSPTENGYLGGDVKADRGEITPTPFVSAPNNIKNFFDTGITNNTQVAVSSGGEKLSYRLSYADVLQKGIVPNTDLRKNTFNINSKMNITNKLSVNLNTSYIKTGSDNRPIQDYEQDNIMYHFIWMGRQINLESLKNRIWQKGFDNEAQFNWNYSYNNNPYFLLYENTNSQTRDRVFGNITALYNISDNLKLMLRTGIDNSNETRGFRRGKSTMSFGRVDYRGNYSERNLFFQEINSDFLLSFDKDLELDFNLNLDFGGNIRNEIRTDRSTGTSGLEIPAFYNFQNTIDPLSGTSRLFRKQVNSLYGAAKLSFNNILFMELTARNDWSSTLPLDNNSYFYPSISLSAIVSDMINLPKFISFLQLRAAYAEVGNDTSPYQLKTTYESSSPWGGIIANRAISTTQKNENLKPETTKSYEFGADLNFFKGRLAFDASYYWSKNIDQIIRVPVSRTTGFSSRFINAGEIQNQGIELLVNAKPIVFRDFSWGFSINYSKNQNKVVELAEGVENLVIGSSGDVTVRASVDNALGVWGRPLSRVSDKSSPHYGKVIVDNRGEPIYEGDQAYFGSYAPDFTTGLFNKFVYKHVSLGFLIDWRKGGKIRSYTESLGWRSGNLEETLQGRENGYDMSDPANGLVYDGVIDNGDGTFRENDIKITPQRYWRTKGYKPLAEHTMHDATYLKLRELRLTYRLPAKFLETVSLISSMDVSLVGNNLLLWGTSSPHFDPETFAGGGNMVPGVETVSLPSERSMGFSINVKF